MSSVDQLQIRLSAFRRDSVIAVALHGGYLALEIHPERMGVARPTINFESDTLMPGEAEVLSAVASDGRYNAFGQMVYYFPLWYTALVLALAAVAATRIERFTLRSALE
jgi:hypothetical protein